MIDIKIWKHDIGKKIELSKIWHVIFSIRHPLFFKGSMFKERWLRLVEIKYQGNDLGSSVKIPQEIWNIVIIIVG